MIVLFTPHIIKGDRRCFRNLWRISRLADEGSGIPRLRLGRSQSGLSVILVRAHRILGRFGRRLDRVSMKLTQIWRPRRSILERGFLDAR
jgi:hypothetical protein